MVPLSAVLRNLFGVTPTRGADARSVAAVSAERVGEVREGQKLVPSLRAALDVSRAGNGVLIFSTMPAEVLATLVLLAMSTVTKENGDPLARAERQHLDAAAGQAVDLAIWFDDMPLTIHELAARIRRLAAEWERFRKSGEPLRRLALVVFDDSSRGAPHEDQSGRSLKRVAAELGVSIVVVQDAKHAE